MTARPSLWRHSDFRKLWIGQTLGLLGAQVAMLAMPLTAILLFDATALQVGALTAAQYGAFLLVGLPAGALVDRWRRRPVLINTDLGRALLLGVVPVAYALDRLELWLLYPIAFGVGVLTVFFDVADQSYLPSLVAPEDLVQGNAKLTMAYSGAQLAGPGLGGLLVQALTAPVAILVTAATFLGSALSVALIRTREPQPERDAAGTSLSADIATGLSYVLRHPLLRPIVLATGIANFFGIFGMVQAIVALFALQDLGIRPATLGVVLGIANGGALLGALATGWLTRRLGPGPAIIASIAVMSGALLLLPLAVPGTGAAVLAVGLGIAWFFVSIFNINQISLRQTVTPKALLGRMNATVRFVIWGPIPLGALAGGWLGDTVGLRNTLWIAGAGGLLAVLPLLRSPLRTMRDLPPAADAGKPPSDPHATPVGAPDA